MEVWRIIGTMKKRGGGILYHVTNDRDTTTVVTKEELRARSLSMTIILLETSMAIK